MPRMDRPKVQGVLAVLAVLAAWGFSPRGTSGAEPPAALGYHEFVHTRAERLRAGETVPASLEAWKSRRALVRKALVEAWGRLPAERERCPLEPKLLGTLKRDGYRVEKIVFQTRPGVWMTANLYVPDAPGKHAAILCVHGHWKGAKQDPVVQARSIGAAKLGFVVLAVDAFGAGERGVGKALGEYHGEMTGATLLPTGLTLSGLQVYENMRAVDYLRTRPEVDPDRIGITGASGGGNQSMYSGAFDERLKAVVPVCSVGDFRVYLDVACCICELVPGALKFTEEWGVLGQVAPRALMIVSATGDAPQFSVARAAGTFEPLKQIFRLYGEPARPKLRHAVFEAKHEYNRPMREALYGWMALHLKGEGDGSPISEPEHAAEDPESLRCYPGASRPDDWMTLPRFAAAVGRKLLAARTLPETAEAWRAEADTRRKALAEKVLGGFPEVLPIRYQGTSSAGLRLDFESEPGVSLSSVLTRASKDGPLAIVIDLERDDSDAARALREASGRAGWSVASFHPRATGAQAPANERIGRAPDHNSAEWAIWIGRPLLGQWTFDVRRLLDAVERTQGGLPREVVVMGHGPAGLVALCAGALDPRITKVAALGTLASYISDEPYQNQRLGVMAPGILREVGDVGHLAALCAPKRVVIAGGVAGGGRPLTIGELRAAYQPALHVENLLEAEGKFSVLDGTEPDEVVRALR